MNRILVVDDEQSMLELVEYALSADGHRVTTLEQGQKAVELLASGQRFDLVISDLRMPDLDGLELLKAAKEEDPETPFIFMTAFASSDTAIEALKLGAFDYITKPFQVDEFKNLVRNALQARNLKLKVKVLESERQDSDLVGTSEPMLEIYKLVGTIADSDTTILISGESGTGKEMVARRVHFHGSRRDHPFVSINCGAFPETLLESELFGYMRGAFTGATSSRKGLFEAAAGGTLFLDEVGEMPLSMQVKLLRALQDKRIRRLGGTEEVQVDVRLVAATNRNLEEEVEAGRFREDLFYRLAVIPIRIPPLRERRDDVLPLVRHFIEKHSTQLEKGVEGITEEALAALEAYDWPGNVRELENVIERAVTLETSVYVQKERLPDQVRRQRGSRPPDTPQISVDDRFDLEEYLKNVEKRLIEQALDLAGGNQTRASRILKLSYRSLRHRIETLGIRKNRKKDSRHE